nr:capsid protein [Cressdnaviricota sp.]
MEKYAYPHKRTHSGNTKYSSGYVNYSSRLAAAIKKKRAVRKAITQITEVKTIDTGFVNNTFAVYSTPPTFIPFSNPAIIPVPGTQTFNRIGNKITYKSLRLTGWIQPVSTINTTIGEDLLCIIVVYDSQPNKAVPVWSDVIQGLSQTGGTSSYPMDSLNINNSERFKILLRQFIQTPQFTGNGTNLTSVYDYANNESVGKIFFDRYIKLKGLPAQFNNANNGNIGDVTKGSLTMAIVAQNSNNAWQFNYQARLRFYDV